MEYQSLDTHKVNMFKDQQSWDAIWMILELRTQNSVNHLFEPFRVFYSFFYIYILLLFHNVELSLCRGYEAWKAP